NEGPRSRWVTGEIYLDQGLEDALNIDRDSFNRFHPEYRVVQEYVHKILRENIFPEVYKQIDVRTQKKAAGKDRSRAQHLRSVLKETLKTPIKVRSTKDNFASASKKGSGLEISMPSEETLDTKKSNRKLAAAVLSIFEVSLKQKNVEETREKFKELLLKL